jgi:predicted ATPase
VNIIFKGAYKSINDFIWNDIPPFAIITGANGAGKSHLLDLIHKKIIGKLHVNNSLEIQGIIIRAHEVVFVSSEWQLTKQSAVGLASIQQRQTNYYNKFLSSSVHSDSEIGLINTFKDIHSKFGDRPRNQIPFEEFCFHLPDFLLTNHSSMAINIAEVFYEYRIDEIEMLATGKTQAEVNRELGERPWVVLRDILKESSLGFEINDPSKKGLREVFTLTITDKITGSEVDFNDLSSGEKVLMSLVYYMYSSQHRNVYPKLMLMDEPDAHLHPAMTLHFLNVIKNILVDKHKMQVIMTTHSPATIILAPYDSVFEMTKTEPRIQKASSKSHAVSLLTAGLVYIGEGTKYFIVEGTSDVQFFSHVNNAMASSKLQINDTPLVFIEASTKNQGGGKLVVQNWVQKLQNSGLSEIIKGLVDQDYDYSEQNGVYRINRYSIENYLIDPIVTYAALLDIEKAPVISGINLSIGEEYKIKTLNAEQLQKIAEVILESIEKELGHFFHDLDGIDRERVGVEMTSGVILQYPNWLLKRRGKTLLNDVYQKVFTSKINYNSLQKSFRKLNMLPVELVDKLNSLRST